MIKDNLIIYTIVLIVTSLISGIVVDRWMNPRAILTIEDTNKIVSFITNYITVNHKRRLLEKVLMKKIMLFTDTDIKNAFNTIYDEITLIFRVEYKLEYSSFIDDFIIKTIKDILMEMAVQHNTNRNNFKFNKR